MNLRDIFLAGAFAQGGGGSVSPEEISQAVKDYLEENPVGVDLAMTGAAVGQIAKITAVDDNGVPTAWEPVDLSSGEKEWKLLAGGNAAAVSEITAESADEISEFFIKLSASVGSASDKMSLWVDGVKWRFFFDITTHPWGNNQVLHAKMLPNAWLLVGTPCVLGNTISNSANDNLVTAPFTPKFNSKIKKISLVVGTEGTTVTCEYEIWVR